MQGCHVGVIGYILTHIARAAVESCALDCKWLNGRGLHEPKIFVGFSVSHPGLKQETNGWTW